MPRLPRERAADGAIASCYLVWGGLVVLAAPLAIVALSLVGGTAMKSCKKSKSRRQSVEVDVE
jgi:hypothetical protein